LCKYYKIILILIIILQCSLSEEIRWKNLNDRDSLAVLTLLDSNNISHNEFWNIVWDLIKVTAQDTEWTIIRLYLKVDSLPAPLYNIPPEIENLERLVCLTIPHHNVDKLPKEIGNMDWMQALDLRYNPISEIPVEIAQCPLLRYLGLAHTNVTSLPDEFVEIDVLKPINIAVDTINGNIYPHGIDLCGLENFTLTERQKAWAGVADYEEYKQKYCQETAVKEPDVNSKKPVASGIHAVVTGYTLRLTLKREGVLSLSLFNSSGRQVSVIFRRKSLSKGSHSIQLSKNIPPGVYFLRGKIGGMRFSRRVVVTGGI